MNERHCVVDLLTSFEGARVQTTIISEESPTADWQ